MGFWKLSPYKELSRATTTRWPRLMTHVETVFHRRWQSSGVYIDENIRYNVGFRVVILS